MRQQVLNPCLPENEYIPDVEPYIFGNRVYLYGSHDRFGAPMFCMNDYVCWSAPLDDLGNWKYGRCDIPGKIRIRKTVWD